MNRIRGTPHSDTSHDPNRNRNLRNFSELCAHVRKSERTRRLRNINTLRGRLSLWPSHRPERGGRNLPVGFSAVLEQRQWEEEQSRSSHYRGKYGRWCIFLVVAKALVLVAFMLPLRRIMAPPNIGPAPAESSGHQTLGGRVVYGEHEGTLRVGDAEISYYHHPAAASFEGETRDGHHHHLVLLHGPGRSKEDWKASGILLMLQRDFPELAVTAPDLPVTRGTRADPRRLTGLLRAMKDAGLAHRLPVSGLVTPAAAGKYVTEWIRNTNRTREQHRSNDGSSSSTPRNREDGLELSQLPEFFRLWVPVASFSVVRCSDPELEALGALSSEFFHVLAVHGDRDEKGKKASERLRERSNATVLELPGRHWVYGDNPQAFARAVGERAVREGGEDPIVLP